MAPRRRSPKGCRHGLRPGTGYPHFVLPTWWRDRQPFVIPSTTRWSVHLSPGHVIQAVAGDVVGGYAGCEEAVGVLLRAAPRHSKTLAESTARYFVASPSDGGLNLRGQTFIDWNEPGAIVASVASVARVRNRQTSDTRAAAGPRGGRPTAVEDGGEHCWLPSVMGP